MRIIARLQNSLEEKFSDTEYTNVGEIHAGGHQCPRGTNICI